MPIYKQATASGGGATTALDNLASVAINTSLLLGTSDGGALGSGTKMWSDLFIASGGVLNFNNGDVTITHTTGALTVQKGSLIVYQNSTDAVAQVLSDTLSDARSRFDLLGNSTNGRGKLTISGAHAGFDGTQNGDGAAILTMIHDNAATNPKKFTFTTAGSPAEMKLDIENDGAGGTHTGIMIWFSDGGVLMGYSGGKIGFYGTTPITKPTSTTDLRAALINLGLYTTGGATPLDLNGGAFTTTGTITGKLSPRVQAVTSSATVTPNADTDDLVVVTAQAAAITFASPSGSPLQGQKLTIRLKDNGTARAITWNAIFRAIGVTLPTTTVISKTMYVSMIYNSTDTKWDVLAVGQEA